MSAKEQGRENVGKIVEIKGVVIDAVFPERLPEITNALRIAMTDADGGPAATSSPKCSSTSVTTACARSPWTRRTAWLAAPTPSTRALPISVPVGPATLGRIWNVIGEQIDKSEPVEGAERWPIHRDAPDFADLSPKLEVFETGHEGRRPHGAVRPRRQDRPLRRRGARQDRAHPGAASTTSRRSTPASPSSPAWGSARARATTSGSRCRSRASSTASRSSTAR